MRRNYLILSAASVFTFYATMYASTAIHEYGHQLASLLVGQKLKGVYLSPFGWSYSYASGSRGATEDFIVTFSGAALQFIAGLFFALIILPRVKGSFSRLLLIQFSFGSMMVPLFYIGSTAVLNYADGAAIVRSTGIPGYLVAIFCAAIFIFLCKHIARAVVSFGEVFFSLKTIVGRFLIFISVFGIPILVQSTVGCLLFNTMPVVVLLVLIVGVPAVCGVVSIFKVELKEMSPRQIPGSFLVWGIMLFEACVIFWANINWGGPH